MPDNHEFLECKAESWLIYWTKMPGWNIRETAALVLGLDPDRNEELSNNDSFLRLRRMLFRARSMGIIQSLDAPKERIEWALSAGFPVPNELISIIYNNRPITNWKDEAIRYKNLYKKKRRKESELEKKFDENSKSKNSLSKLIYLMAVDKYRFKRDHSSAASNICKAATRLGLDAFPTPPVVAAWLKRAADEVD